MNKITKRVFLKYLAWSANNAALSNTCCKYATRSFVMFLFIYVPELRFIVAINVLFMAKKNYMAK